MPYKDFNKAFNIAEKPKYDGYQRGLASMVNNFFVKSLLHLQINLLRVVVSILLLNKMNN